MSEEEKKDVQEEAPQDIQVKEKIEEEFSFVKERFKDELPSGRRLFYKSLKLVGCGVIFGVAASFAFYALKPFVEERFGASPAEIRILQDEDEQEDEGTTQDPQEEQLPAVLTIDNYKELNKALLPIVNEVGKSIVEVRGVLAEEAWSEGSYDERNSVSGIFMADNGQEVLILTYASILQEAIELQVTFVDNQTYLATPKVQDGNTGLAVVSIVKADIKESTWNQITPATLGNSNVVSRGDVSIAIGKQHGFAGSMSYGIISASKHHVEKIDGTYGVLNTDMPASPDGTGVLLNLAGEIVGIIDQRIPSGNNEHLITAYAVSDMKIPLNNLLNGKGIPYVGIRGVDITDVIAEQEGLPDGMYVREVMPDSPAMIAGVKTGDIITGVAGGEISTLAGYQRQLMEFQVGEIIKVTGKRLGNEGYADVQFDITIGNIE
jgi:Trypsin-like serine proteases, typically periplasmic, contain C-terminal PDZ domain